jgi:hypothetical protein
MPGIEHEAAVTRVIRLTPSEAIRQALEELMTTVFPRDDFIDGLLDQGRAEGEARGEAKTLLRVLSARGFAVPDDVGERVADCTDTHQLEKWADRAVSASSITEVFGD